MSSIQKISVALPSKMVSVVRQAVDKGEYSSSSEVVRDALRDWSEKRRLRRENIKELRRIWQKALEDKTPGLPIEPVLDRLERKYQALADAAKR